jgi:hypothetical protein
MAVGEREIPGKGNGFNRENSMTTLRLLGVSTVFILLTLTAVQAQNLGMRGLHDGLNLRPEQEDSWQTFQNANIADPEETARRRNAAETMPNLTAPQRMDLSINLLKGDLDALVRRGAALKAFYATLSPEQQSAFDRKTMPGQR